MDLWRREARPVLDAAMTWKRYDDYMARSIGQLARYAQEDLREYVGRHRRLMEAGIPCGFTEAGEFIDAFRKASELTSPRRTRDPTQSERRWLANFMGAHERLVLGYCWRADRCEHSCAADSGHVDSVERQRGGE